MRNAVIVLGALCLLQATGLRAEEPQAKESAGAAGAAGAARVGDTDLRALLREVGQRLHKKIIWDPRLQATVELGSLQRQELTYAQLLAVLQINGYVAIESDDLLEVLPTVEGRQSPTPVFPAESIKGPDDEIVTVVLGLHNVSAAQLVPVLRPLMPQYGHLAAFSDRNALILTDRGANARRIVEIARAIDALPKASADLSSSFAPKTHD